MKRIVIASMLLLAACSTKPVKPVVEYSQDDVEYIEKYKEYAAGDYKVGKEYKINGEWYYPQHEPTYEQEGKASWYGPGLEGNKTANGEIIDLNDYTAAHTTLPMPSIVEVTNLDNGKVVHVRVNDRGPFHSKRIIDVSKAAAKELGMIKTGTANVRVRLLPQETLEYLQYAGE